MTSFVLIISLISFVATSVSATHESSPVIQTKDGPVRGRRYLFENDYLGLEQNVTVFLGIPYAEPPVGELRFKPPVPVIPREDVFEATEIPNACVHRLEPYFQHQHNARNISEDCLYLNIFVPRTTTKDAAVMIWIHGGLLERGSGLSHPVDPVPLSVVGDVIVVTINYRLGILGFMSTGDDVIPPNNGLLDQRLAIQWIYENIAEFGGDPNSITLFGQGSGGASVSWHACSEDSRQFFQRGIMQSGDPYESWSILISPEEAARRAKGTAKLIGCEDPGSSEAVLECFGQASADTLAIVSVEKNELLGVDQAWIPVEDGVFFTKSIEELIDEGAMQDIDILIGSNRDDGTFLTWATNAFAVDRPFIDFEAFALLSSFKDITDPVIADLVRVLYVSDEDFPGNQERALSASFGDTHFHCGVKRFAEQAQMAGSTVYMYYMTFEPANSVWNSTWNGAGLDEELQFVFGLPFQSEERPDVSEVEKNFSLNVMQLWSNFAKTGNPTDSSNPDYDYLDLNWPEFTSEDQDYIELNVGFENKTHLRSKYCRFWKVIKPTLAARDKELQRLRRNLSLRLRGLYLG